VNGVDIVLVVSVITVIWISLIIVWLNTSKKVKHSLREAGKSFVIAIYDAIEMVIPIPPESHMWFYNKFTPKAIRAIKYRITSLEYTDRYYGKSTRMPGVGEVVEYVNDTDLFYGKRSLCGNYYDIKDLELYRPTGINQIYNKENT